MSGGPYFGKYRGMVMNNIDPLGVGRLMVSIPDVCELEAGAWCDPCFPVAGMQMGIIAVPVIGSGVYVEFEQGNPEYPIWVGCWLNTAAEKPMLADTVPPPVPSITLQTPLGNGIVISDALGPTGAGGIVIKDASGAMIAVNDTGITITNGKGATIRLMGPTVDVNFGALTVT